MGRSRPTMTDDTRPETPDPPVEAVLSSDDVDPEGSNAEAAADDPASGDGRSDLERERDEYRDLLLRKIERERESVDQAAAADLITELLPLIDDLERALAAEVDSDGAASYRAGVELIHKQLLDVLAKRGVTPIETAGQDFDPHLHEAVAHESSDDHRDGEIIDELRRGYVMGGRLLRASMVRVAKA